jgi:hypothetical protein
MVLGTCLLESQAAKHINSTALSYEFDRKTYSRNRRKGRRYPAFQTSFKSISQQLQHTDSQQSPTTTAVPKADRPMWWPRHSDQEVCCSSVDEEGIAFLHVLEIVVLDFPQNQVCVDWEMFLENKLKLLKAC